ncbi:hypothetical protein NE619_04425 [Anaerovorax odorimutans]|uniref:Protein translocase subunit SecA n=1 Tax=Anaerovorax odorimutans TaxID=109327 RepID=A0ABT1RLA5_9FIRM|nr:DEAD/DEAH box helicase [Anaerovorax odorimutans]MCQ4635962.1 hypothetical protein [Anaerovorax odorimutans]
MIKKMSLKRRPVLPYKEFVEKVKAYDWSGAADRELRARLRSIHAAKDPEVYSILSEIIFRCKSVRLFESQIAAAYSMERGEIAELPTGEGKTLAAAVSAASLALNGRHVHILVYNDYLTQRDFENNQRIFAFCGLTCACILQNSEFADRKEAYRKNVLYITAKEAGFDFLRNFMAEEKGQLYEHEFDTAIVDEADSILIDEARNPLVIAGKEREHDCDYKSIWEVKKALLEEDIEVKAEDRQVWLTERGVLHAEHLLGIENLFLPENAEYLAILHTLLEAELFYKRDREYLVKDGCIYIIDENTGRIAKDRKFAGYLHQAIAVKEGVDGGDEMMILNMIPMQFFLLQYRELCGMTGTGWSARKEIRSMYGLNVCRIPPHCPCRRIDHEDRVYPSGTEWKRAMIRKIMKLHEKGQPILIGTQSIGESQVLADSLKEKSLKPFVLNAKQHEKEAELIAHAADPYRITISTNMAGRGVDIVLGKENKPDQDFVKNAGGLFVLGAGINRSRRIDDQLRGRAGRQGDPGESQFFISSKQELIETFLRREPRIKENYKVRSIQRIIESFDAQQRYILEKYSIILEKQRQLISEYRESVLRFPETITFLKDKAPQLYSLKLLEGGEAGVIRAQQQLLLYYINEHWADYLLTMENVREGIHLVILGKENPIDVYQRFADKAFWEMEEDIKEDVLGKLKTCKITENGLDLKVEGLNKSTSTQTFMIDESKGQFASPRGILGGHSG